MVISASRETFRQVNLLHYVTGIIVGIPIVLPVLRLTHQRRNGIAQMQRHRIVSSLLHVFLGVEIALVGRVALRSGCQVDRGLGHGYEPLGHADEVYRLLCSHGYH